MYPGLLLFLLLAAINSGCLAFLPEDNTGQKFIVAFPENIAYYHPDKAQNKILITALYSNTNVSFTFQGNIFMTQTMNIAESKEFNIQKDVDLNRSEISNKTIIITSTMNIIVHAISHKNNSVQTALVISTDKLGKEYLIPPIPKIQGTTDQVAIEVTERYPFKLFIISMDQKTQVTVDGANTKKVSLAPLHVAQIWLQKADELRTVTADQPVAVLFGHPCAMRDSCNCGMLYNVLPPAKKETVKFFVPPIPANDAHDKTFLLLSETKSTTAVAYDPNSPMVEVAGTAMFYRPGLLLPLIPETDFGACFMVNPISGTQSSVVIVVQRKFTDGVHIGNRPLENATWWALRGTIYTSTEVELAKQTNIIWHSSSKMAVYFWGKNGSALFGNPAAIISQSPDFRGCALKQEHVEIGKVAVGWRESLKYCKDNNLELVTFSDSRHVELIHKRLIQAKDTNVQVVWIGMRRSSLTGEWYWVNNKPVKATNWGVDEPGTVYEGQCAIMSLVSGKWSDAHCCKAAHPVCYKRPTFLPLWKAAP